MKKQIDIKENTPFTIPFILWVVLYAGMCFALIIMIIFDIIKYGFINYFLNFVSENNRIFLYIITALLFLLFGLFLYLLGKIFR